MSIYDICKPARFVINWYCFRQTGLPVPPDAQEKTYRRRLP